MFENSLVLIFCFSFCENVPYVDEFVRLFAGNIGYVLFYFIFAISPYFLLKLQINFFSHFDTLDDLYWEYRLSGPGTDDLF